MARSCQPKTFMPLTNRVLGELQALGPHQAQNPGQRIAQPAGGGVGSLAQLGPAEQEWVGNRAARCEEAQQAANCQARGRQAATPAPPGTCPPAQASAYESTRISLVVRQHGLHDKGAPAAAAHGGADLQPWPHCRKGIESTLNFSATAAVGAIGTLHYRISSLVALHIWWRRHIRTHRRRRRRHRISPLLLPPPPGLHPRQQRRLVSSTHLPPAPHQQLTPTSSDSKCNPSTHLPPAPHQQLTPRRRKRRCHSCTASARVVHAPTCIQHPIST